MCSDCEDLDTSDDDLLDGMSTKIDVTPPVPVQALAAAQEFDEQGRGYWNCPGMDARVDGSSGSADQHLHEVRHPSSKAEANLVSSLCEDGKHRPVLDIDIPLRFVPSTTPGHCHLYIDKPMTWAGYAALMIALRDAGILEEGYLQAALSRGASFVRPEWVKKPEGSGTPIKAEVKPLLSPKVTKKLPGEPLMPGDPGFWEQFE